jgi:hypothetical protein
MEVAKILALPHQLSINQFERELNNSVSGYVGDFAIGGARYVRNWNPKQWVVERVK